MKAKAKRKETKKSIAEINANKELFARVEWEFMTATNLLPIYSIVLCIKL